MAKKTDNTSELLMNNVMISGEAFYCFTTKVNRTGKFPSNCYEIGIANPVCDSGDDISAYIKTAKVKDDKGKEFEVPYIKIANSKYQFAMFDKFAEKLEKPVSLSNGTAIRVNCNEKYNKQFDTNYLVVSAVQVLDDITEFNPFK